MARRSSIYAAPSTLTRAYQRSLKALTKGTLRSGTRIAGEAARAAAKQLKPPRGPDDWLAGVAIGAGGARRITCTARPTCEATSACRCCSCCTAADRLVAISRSAPG